MNLINKSKPKLFFFFYKNARKPIELIEEAKRKKGRSGRTWQGDVDLEGAALVRGSDGAGDGSDEAGESGVGLGSDSDAGALHVFTAFLELLLNSSEVYHLLR